ncbi:MAG: DUF1850 domain-containing protein [Rhodobacterales bacterium]
MTGTGIGRSCGAALWVLITLGTVPVWSKDALVVETRDGLRLGQLAFDDGAEICLSWAHSVTGGAVSDCFENRKGQMVLTRSYLHDFAAGLGEVAGRGTLRAAQGGGYWIDGIDEALDASGLTLRIGAPHVGHILGSDQQSLNLSAMAPGVRVSLRLQSDMP